ncbi:hypothetical protein MNBD_GAMMA26-1995 [hydrothermal vent metagenome]|uniref:Uncharacterized protein n=1 Tax=hydrothermal vent metagenome TaxID=652676 RepID=A0A3B1BQN0_9ZZZZ
MNPEEYKEWQDKVAADIRELANPINLAELEAKGVFSTEGDWYRIHEFGDLPEAAKSKIAELSQDDKGIKVKFIDTSKLAGIAEKLEQHGL